MSDKLKWMNRHLVLLRHLTMQEVIKDENYKLNPELEEMYQGVTSTQEMVWKFADVERWKMASELLMYTAHKRACVWWGYLCVLSLCEELRQVPAEDRDIAKIATSFEPKIPDFAKIKPKEVPQELVDGLEGKLKSIQSHIEELKQAVDPEIYADVEEAYNYAFDLFKEEFGNTPMELLEMTLEKEKDPLPIDENSPIFKAADALEAQLQASRKETIDTIKSVLPPKLPEREKKIRDNTLQAVYRWIVSPDEVNSQKALDMGNECPDTPAGLLSLCAFWAFGDLMPMGEQVVPTPAGLAANGLCQLLLMCALHKGGTRKLKERFEHYFELGVEVITGQNNWDKNVKTGEVPHLQSQSFERVSPKQEIPLVKQEVVQPPAIKKDDVVYRRWKPGMPEK